ncbi:conserved hypothetical protein [Tenacibaculum maritimum]|uniref:hypothetical protein n=1 Tax=Tenacibaculum maritimum TaxID=107401 RepID=UPI0012E60338|nr:hypothetical protein [Tenacibaculum maritimum]CAA0228101.1 conserved hypothetical protein [Tenacibaculum maritimum]
MKYLAHIENSLESRIISIYDVIRGLNGNAPEEWESRTYYSLWYNTPMIAKVNSKKMKPHFAFKSGFGGNENSGGGESIEHQLSKKIIYDSKTLNLKIGNIEDILEFSDVVIEKSFDEGKYITDLHCKIKLENKFKFPVDSTLAIELHYKNRVKKSKQKFYRDNNITSIEIDIWKEIKFTGDLDKLQRQLNGYFKKQRFAKRLHDPNWKDFLKQREIEKQKAEETKKKKLEFIRQKRDNNKRLKLEQTINTFEVKPNIEIKVPLDRNVLNPKKSFWKRIFEFIFK